MRKPELLSPAGDWEKLQMAVLYGADAVYLAGTSFGMRSFAGNFDDEALPKAVAFAHDHGVKVHATVNTMPRWNEAEQLPAHLEKLDAAGVDALILADRPDILSERFRKELKKLQTNALPFDDHLAIRLIEDELGAEIKDVFSEFNPHCIASASIGQVYTGRLKNGKDVVIKIRRPNIDQKIKLDLYLMRYLAKKLALEYPEMAAINIVGVVDEFGESIFKELN